jgi:sigma-54 dependent transcriptional regulator, acetoin dehydrogenase operon transcriptional activator AcoR
LRERLEDLPELIRSIWTRQGPDDELPRGLLTAECLVPLRAHAWPGNVRELDQFLRRLRLRLERSGGRRISPHQIWTMLAGTTLTRGASGSVGSLSTDHVRTVLRECRGNRLMAARTLGVARSTFYRMLDERGLSRKKPDAGLGGPAGEA